MTSFFVVWSSIFEEVQISLCCNVESRVSITSYIISTCINLFTSNRIRFFNKKDSSEMKPVGRIFTFV